MSVDKSFGSKEIINIETVSGYTNWGDGWTIMMDSSHTVKKDFYFGDVFPMSVQVNFVNDVEVFVKTDFKNYVSKSDFSSIVDKSYAFTVYDFDNYPNIVFVVLPHSSAKDDGTKSHEISHAVDRVMKRLGLEGTECRAYMIGYLMREMGTIPQWKKNEYQIIKFR